MRTSIGKSLAETGMFKGPFPSGAPAIFIYNIASLGIPAGFISSVGNDRFAECCLQHLSQMDIDLSAVTRSSVPTGVAFVMYNHDGSREFLFHLGNSAAGQLNDTHVNETFLQRYNWLHLNGSTMAINQNLRLACMKAAELMKKQGGIVSFDPNLRKELLSEDAIKEICTPILPICDYVLPSEGEELTITGKANRQDAIEYLLSLGIKKIFLKLGKRGSEVYTRDSQLFKPSYAIEEIDPTGAGDSFCAGVVYGITKGWGDGKTLQFANALGAFSATHFGPMTWQVDEKVIWRFIEEKEAQ